MATSGYMNGHEFCVALVKALGLEGQAVRKIVIEADVRDAPTVYVKGVVKREQCQAVADVLRVVHVEDVRVTDRGEVEVDKPVVVVEPERRP